MIVGEKGHYNCLYGSSDPANGGSGGGGGSFIWLDENQELLIAAGGGGGGGICASAGNPQTDGGGNASMGTGLDGYSGQTSSNGIGWPAVISDAVFDVECQNGGSFGGGYGGGGNTLQHNGGGGGDILEVMEVTHGQEVLEGLPISLLSGQIKRQCHTTLMGAIS